MKNTKKKILMLLILMLIIIPLTISTIWYINNQIITVSENIPKTVTLGENNCTIVEENYVATIQKYNGNAETIVINKDMVNSEKVEIDYGAFSECFNLETILIDKTIVGDGLEIEDFEIDNDYENEQYVQYKTTKNYSEGYKQYLALTDEEKSEVEVIPNKYDVSINALYSESMETNYKVSELAGTTMPESFDLRDEIDIKVENQGATGICYAFASLTAVETNLALIHDDNVDLSEVHMACLADNSELYGGRFIPDTDSYYTDEVGPVYESEWPIAKLWETNKDSTTYVIHRCLTIPNSSMSTTIKNILKETEAKRNVTETVNFPSITKGSNSYDDVDIESVRKAVKKHIMEYGSIFAGVSSGAIQEQNGYFVSNATVSDQVDHAVSIVGWDDNFSRENFSTGNMPESDGAYLALNSWGDTWGNAGYFWISYEDYWAETNMCGVISVENIQSISFDSVGITNTDTNEQILSNKVVKGTNIQVEINALAEILIDNQNEFIINVISPSGEDIANEITISGNTIENNEAKILLNIDTTDLEIGEYTINLKYGDEIISTTIEITNGTIEGIGWYYVTEEYKLYILENLADRTYDYLKDDIHIVEFKEPITSLLAHQFEGYENLKEVILPATLTELKISAFKDCTSLQKINIPEGVKEIGIRTFTNCTSLESIILPQNVTSIGNRAFYGCTNLKLVDALGEGISIEEAAFYECVNLEINIEKGIRNVGNYAFTRCAKIETINIIEGAIGDYAFYGCTNLQSVKMQEGVESVGLAAFYGCTNLKTVDMLAEVVNVGEAAFYECSNLENVNVVKGISNIGNHAFTRCTKLQTINIESGTIGESAFLECTNLKTVNMQEGVISVGKSSFWECTALENVNMEEGITSIGYAGFAYCPNLKNLEIPESVKSIGSFAFFESTTHIKIENGKIPFEELQRIIQRTMTNGDLLYCNGSITIDNAAFSEDNTELIVDDNAEVVTISISKGNLKGLVISAEVLYRTITYSETELTPGDVIATFNMAEGDTITNNEGKNTFTFTDNGEFELEFTNINGLQKTLTGKVENIDKQSPEVKVTKNPTDWTTDNVVLTIEATDLGVGLHETAYSFDGGENWQAENTKTYTENTTGIQIKVRDAFENITTYELIDISNIKRLEGLQVTMPPDKTEYNIHENFDITGMIVKIIYNNGEEEETTDYVIVNGTDLTCKVEKIEIQYTENPNIKTEIPIDVAHDMTEATCTDEAKCKVEGCTEKGTKLPHTEVIDERVEPTCTETGLTEGKHCEKCKEVLTKQEEIPVLEHKYENGKCTVCNELEPIIEITSKKYQIRNEYILDIETKTTVKAFKEELETNATEIKIYNKDKKLLADDTILATGMQIELKLENETKTLKTVVGGDINGDGKADFKDIVGVNKHRLRKTLLKGEYLLAGDVTADDEVDFKDMLKINQYRLNKIKQFFIMLFT